MADTTDTDPIPRLVYVAGPIFDDGERWWIQEIERCVADAGLDTFLPHRDNPPKTADNVGDIFRNNRDAIDRSDLLIASLNGIITDDGTAWEIGYAAASATPMIGIHTDWRRRFDDEVVNLMIECSLDAIVHSLEELRDSLLPESR